MEVSSTVVVKVKHGDMLRRFNAEVVGGKELNLNMEGLRKKILSLFSFAPDTELMLAYTDEDGDVVALVDEDDLHDVVRQALNPLRITVNVGAEKGPRQYNLSSGSSTPLRSPRPLQNLNTGVSEILRSVPEPLRETFVKLSADLASKASSSAPGITELVDSFSKVGLSVLGHLAEFQSVVNSGTQGGVRESSTLDMEKLKPEASVVNNDEKINNATGGRIGDSSIGSNAAAAVLESQNIVAQPQNDSSLNSTPGHPKLGVDSKVVAKKKVKKIIKGNSNGKSLSSVAETQTTGVEVNSSRDPINVIASDPSRGDYAADKTTSPDGFGKPPGSIGVPGVGSSKFPGLSYGSNPMYECPFSGIAVGGFSAAPPHPAPEIVLARSSTGLIDGGENSFHRGVRCDGCGVHPITGPRFKSIVKVDYDLCSICFEKMGNYADYIRIDRPVIYRHHMMPFKGLHDARSRDHCPMLPQVQRGSKIKQGPAKLDSRFIHDVNIIDGTVMAPLTPFTKIWRMRNNGTVAWPQDTQLVWIGGDKLSNAFSVQVEIPAAGLLIDQELDIAVDFISPELPGRYISYWRLASPSGQKFGQRVWVLIQVDASVQETPRRNIRNLNLNLPPASSCLPCPEIIYVNPEPTVKTSNPEPDNSNKTVELVQPVIDSQPNTEQELKFPINDSLLVGNVASSSLPSASTSVSYPIIDLSDVVPALPSVPPLVSYPLPQPTSSAASAHPSAVDVSGQKQMEEKLLSDLNEMGFKQVDLNKEVLRVNEYDLEKAVDDLCAFPEWDPILDELQEMGFNDTEMNKMLLKKNNGSIKRVVMDLIAGEKI